jgi:hypothetical protein
MSDVGFRLRAGWVPAPRGQHGRAAEKRDDSRVVLIGQIAFGPPQSGPDRRISNWQRSVSEYSGMPRCPIMGWSGPAPAPPAISWPGARRDFVLPDVFDPMGSNDHCEQFDHSESNHQHRDRYRIVIEPMPLLCIHDAPPCYSSFDDIRTQCVGPHCCGSLFLRFELLDERSDMQGDGSRESVVLDPEVVPN